MPRVAVYENQAAPARVTDAKFRPADDRSGEIIGRAVAGFGQALGQAAGTYADIEESAARDADTEFATAAMKLRYDPDTGYLNQQGRNAVEGLEPARKAFQSTANEIGAKLGKGARRIFDRRVAERMAGYNAEMDRHFAGEREKWQDSSFETNVNATVSDAVVAYGDEDVQDSLIGRMVKSYGEYAHRKGLDDATGLALAQNKVSEVRLKSTLRLAEQDATSAESYLTRHAGQMTGDDQATAERGLRIAQAREAVEQRRLQAEQEGRDAVGKAQIRESIQLVQARIEAGEDVSDADIQRAAEQARSLGDDSTGYKLDVAVVKAGVNRETRSWSPTKFADEINTLRGKGEKRTPAEDIRLNQLETIAPSRRVEFDSNPGAWAARNGAPPPALNWSDPATIVARSRWASSVGAAAGRPAVLLTPEEQKSLSVQASADPKGRLAVADKLALFGGRNAVRAARQVAPGDDMLARLVVLRRGDRASVLNGAEARKAHPQLVDGKAAPDVREAFDERLGNAAGLMGQGDLAAVYEVARSMYADAAAKEGATEFDAERFPAYIHRALGGTKDAQGVWHGGIGYRGGAPVLLPQWMSQSQFDTVLARVNWPAGKGPVYRNGAAMEREDVLKLTPVLRPDGRYEFHGRDGQIATRRDGSAWAIDLDSIGRRYLK